RPREEVVEGLLTTRPFVRVVDLGCGTGRWMAAQPILLADSRVTLVGVDPSSAMLGEARAKGIFNVIRAQAEDIPLGNAAVDYITSSYAFHHFSDKDRALDEVG